MDLALTVTFVGLFVTFLALIILAFLISLNSKVFAITIPKHDKTAGNSENKKISNLAKKKGSAANNALDESELIAVLTAAVMASMQTTPDFKIRIKSFRRIHKISSVWGAAGIAEQTGSRF